MGIIKISQEHFRVEGEHRKKSIHWIWISQRNPFDGDSSYSFQDLFARVKISSNVLTFSIVILGECRIERMCCNFNGVIMLQFLVFDQNPTRNQKKNLYPAKIGDSDSGIRIDLGITLIFSHFGIGRFYQNGNRNRNQVYPGIAHLWYPDTQLNGPRIGLWAAKNRNCHSFLTVGILKPHLCLF